MRMIFLYIIICLSLCTTKLLSQDDDQQPVQIEATIDKDSYDAKVKELDWSKTKRALRPRPQKKREKTKEKKTNSGSFLKIGGAGIQILGYGAVLVLLGFIIYLILDNIKINPRLEKSEFEITAMEDIRDIEEIDAQSGLQEALERGDYRAAFSMHYILVLQNLSSEDRISWEPSKTNRDYIREMRKDEHGEEFRLVSNTYDLSLYGDRPFGKEEYEALLPQLQLLTVSQTISA